MFVADTHNNKLKVVDPRTGEAKSWLGQELLNQPTDIKSASFGTTTYLLIADSSNHQIRSIRLSAKPKIETLLVNFNEIAETETT